MKYFNVLETIRTIESPTDRQERIAWWKQESLRSARIVVIGAGAIGNETLKNLALLGFRHVFVADFDTISTSNLSRTVLFRKEDVGRRKAEIAAQRTVELAVDDSMQVDYFHGDVVWEIGTGLYHNADLVLGCLDNIETRIALNRQCYLSGTPWIDAGISELGCRVSLFSPKEVYPCYECGLTSEQLQSARRRYSCDSFKQKAYAEDRVATTQIASALVSALQVQEAVKLLCGLPMDYGKKLYYQGCNHAFEVMKTDFNPNCTSHLLSYPAIQPCNLGTEVPLREFLSHVALTYYGGKEVELDLTGDRSFVETVRCRRTGRSIPMMQPQWKVHSDELELPSGSPESTEQGDDIFHSVFSMSSTPPEILSLTLHEIGVPYWPILTLRAKSENFPSSKNENMYLRLDGDSSILAPRWKPRQVSA